jgi:hypothetical protein
VACDEFARLRQRARVRSHHRCVRGSVAERVSGAGIGWERQTSRLFDPVPNAQARANISRLEKRIFADSISRSVGAGLTAVTGGFAVAKTSEE